MNFAKQKAVISVLRSFVAADKSTIITFDFIGREVAIVGAQTTVRFQDALEPADALGAERGIARCLGKAALNILPKRTKKDNWTLGFAKGRLECGPLSCPAEEGAPCLIQAGPIRVGSFSEDCATALQFASEDITRPNLNAVFFESRTMVTTDGHRLYREVDCLHEGGAFVLPRLVAQNVGETADVNTMKAEQGPQEKPPMVGERPLTAVTSLASMRVTFDFVEPGQFPEYRRVIPDVSTGYETRITAREELLQALSIVKMQKCQDGVIIRTGPDGCTLTYTLGDDYEKRTIQVSTGALPVNVFGVNWRYLQEAVEAAQDDGFTVYLPDDGKEDPEKGIASTSPMVVEAFGQTHVIMGMRL